MINKTPDVRYWSTGITLTWSEHATRDTDGNPIPGWSASADYFDDGWSGDDNADAGTVSTQGSLSTRYAVADGEHVTGLSAVIDALIHDVEWLGVTFKPASGAPPMLYYRGDGEDPDFPPPSGWRELLAAEAQRIGWASYSLPQAAE